DHGIVGWMAVAKFTLAMAFALIGCGRIRFDILDDGALSGDGTTLVDADPIPDLVVRYPMDVIAGSAAPAPIPLDDGTRPATCPTIVVGVRGNAYDFDGNTTIDLPSISAGLVGLAPYTVTVWASVDPYTDNRSIVTKPYSTTSDANVL